MVKFAKENTDLGSFGETEVEKKQKNLESGSKLEYFSLRPTEKAQVRIVSARITRIKHYDKASKKSSLCPKYFDESAQCDYCASGVYAQVRSYVHIIDRRDGKVKIWEMSKTVVEAVRAELLLIKAKDKENKLEDYELSVLRIGQGLKTEYKLDHSETKISLKAEEKELIKNLKNLESVIIIRVKDDEDKQEVNIQKELAEIKEKELEVDVETDITSIDDNSFDNILEGLE